MESHADDTDWTDETDFLLLIAYYFFFFTTDSLPLTADLFSSFPLTADLSLTADGFLTADSADLNRFIQISSFSDC